MNVYTYVGITPRSLASGRPITFGTELQETDLAPADESIRAYLASPAAPAPDKPFQATPEPEAI